VLNYVDFAAGTLNESVDGPVHRSGLDDCEDIDTFRADRFELATEATTDLIMAMVDPSITSTDARLSAADAVMEKYMSYENKGCTLSNNWCDAPELNYARDNQQSCGCRTVESTGGAGFGLAAAFGALVFAARRRRRTLSIGLGGAVGLLAFIAPGAAHAQNAVATPMVEPTEQPTNNPDQAAVAAPTVEPTQQPTTNPDQAVATDRGVVDTTPVHKGREGTPFGVIVEGGGALYKNGAVAGSVGFLYRLSSHFLLGVEGEYNPWFSTDDFNMKPGSTNIYADGVLRFPLHFQRVNLRSTLQAGISRMNFDLYGVPQGSVGPFVGLNVLGIDYELAKSLYLVINPAHIAVPIPKVSGGVPFYYPQYRLTLGIQFGA
jgi:MYXO-CTERM domain-containing protein